MALDKDWTAAVGNRWKSRKIWEQLLKILGKEGAKPRVSGILFKAVMQAVLIFRGIDVGDEPLHRMVPEGFLTQSRHTYQWKAASLVARRKSGIFTFEYGDAGGGFLGCGGVCTDEA